MNDTIGRTDSDRRLQVLAEQRLVGVIEWDLEFKVRSWNAAAVAIFGHTESEAFGRHASFIVADEAREHVERVFEQLILQTGGSYSTNANLTSTGTAITCEWFNNAIVVDGVVQGVLSLVHDVTKRVNAEAQVRRLNAELEQRVADRTAALNTAKGEAEEASRAKGEFLTEMAHELRTPLNAIIGFARILDREIGSDLDERHRSFLDNVLTGGERMLTLVNDLLARRA